ncbi:MAG: aminotransferase class V-fold PLP-dependent enzyme [Thermaerobacterales bacterium]
MEELLPAIRADFPALEKYIYLDVAGRNPLSNRVRRAVDAFLDDRQSGAYTKPDWFERVEQTRRRMARLVGAHTDEIAMTKNTSEGLNAIAAAIEWRPGDNVVVAADLEHPNNLYPWLNLRSQGVDVRLVPSRGPAVTAADLEPVVDRRTRVVSLAAVSFATGGRNDLASVSVLCHAFGAMLVVDAVQALGVLDFQVEHLGVDAFAAGTNKGLLGLYGLGVLYCRRSWIERLTPKYLSRNGVFVEGSEDEILGSPEHVMGNADFTLHNSARRFELGNFNFLGVHGLQAGLEQIADIGVPAIEKHVLRLSERLSLGIQDRGYRLVSPASGSQLSGVVVFQRSRHGDADGLHSLAQHLERSKVRFALRRGCIRLSLHFYNNDNDIDQFLEILDNYRAVQPHSGCMRKDVGL